MWAVTNENRCCKLSLQVCVFTFYTSSVYIRIFTLWSLYVASHKCNVYFYDVKSNPWSEQKAHCDSLWVEMLKEIVCVCSCMCVGNWGEETENGVGVRLNKRSLSAALETISSAGDISIKASPGQPRWLSNENRLSNFLIQYLNLLWYLSDLPCQTDAAVWGTQKVVAETVQVCPCRQETRSHLKVMLQRLVLPGGAAGLQAAHL